MTDRTIEQSMEDELRDIELALMRAAQPARERARATGTRLALSRNGVLEFIPPERLEVSSQEVAECSGRYGVQE